MARRDPGALVGGAHPVTLDEVQREPGLPSAVKREIDRDRRPGRFLLTGSANLLLMRRISESLAGRASYLTLWTMTRREQMGLGRRGAWEELIKTPDAEWLDVFAARPGDPVDWRAEALRGGFPVPAVHLGSPDERAIWFDGYVRTYLERDLQMLSSGARLESLVLQDLLTWRDSRLGSAEVLHWRATTGEEVDFVIEVEGEWSPDVVYTPFDGGYARFGSSIVHRGDEIWIGAPLAGDFEGRAYVLSWDPEAEDWGGMTKFAVDDLVQGDGMGPVVALGEAVGVVGLQGDDFGSGTAVIIERQGDGGWTSGAKVASEIAGLDAVTDGDVECEDGSAGDFTCTSVDMVSFLPVQEIGGTRGMQVNDVWGWTDPVTGTEWALVGRYDGTAFIDLSDPGNPVYTGDLPLTEGANPNVWRDIKVYRDHAYIVSDGAGEHGMQVFDLTRLRDVAAPPVTFEATAHYDRIHSAHNIVINEETGFAYAVGASGGGDTCGGGLHMIDIREPASPVFAGCFADATTGRQMTGYSHDAMCIIYEGPDEDHRGKEICFGSNETALSIADVSDKDAPVALAMESHPNSAIRTRAGSTPSTSTST